MYRVSMLFDYMSLGENRHGGWSESWLFSGSSLTDAKAALQAIANRRATFAHSLIKIVGARYQEIDSNFKATGVAFAERLSIAGSLVQGVSLDIPQVAVVARIKGLAPDGTQRRRFAFLRGLTDESTANGSFLNSTFPMQAHLRAYLNALSAWNFGFKAVKRNVKSRLLGVNAGGAFTIADPLALAVGTTVQLLHVRDTTGHAIRGKFTVTAPVTTTSGTFNAWPGQTVGESGEVRISGFEYIPVAMVGASDNPAERTSVKKVGRPFDLYHGRFPRVAS